jgi:tRNA threonylcarbamoyladenosine biosynthesis protein TsaE
LNKTFELDDAAATGALGARLAAVLPADSAGWAILLQGELGAGKSTLARALLHGLGHAGLVPSPTYTLVEPYAIRGRIIYHIDLYRINDADELQYLGWSDWADGLLLVEWPERAPAYLDTADIRVRLDYAGHGRRAKVSAITARGAELVERLAKANASS